MDCESENIKSFYYRNPVKKETIIQYYQTNAVRKKRTKRDQPPKWIFEVYVIIYIFCLSQIRFIITTHLMRYYLLEYHPFNIRIISSTPARTSPSCPLRVNHFILTIYSSLCVCEWTWLPKNLFLTWNTKKSQPNELFISTFQTHRTTHPHRLANKRHEEG